MNSKLSTLNGHELVSENMLDYERSIIDYFTGNPSKVNYSEAYSCLEFLKQRYLVTKRTDLFRLFGDNLRSSLTLDFLIETDDELLGLEVTEVPSREKKANNVANRRGSGWLQVTNLDEAWSGIGGYDSQEEEAITAKTKLINETVIPSIINLPKHGGQSNLHEEARIYFEKMQEAKSSKLQQVKVVGNKTNRYILIYHITHTLLASSRHYQPLLRDMKSRVGIINLDNDKKFDEILFLLEPRDGKNQREFFE